MLTTGQALCKCFMYIILFNLTRKARIPAAELLLLITLLWLKGQSQEMVAVMKLGRAWTRGVVAGMKKRRRIQVTLMGWKCLGLGNSLGEVGEEILESKKSSRLLWRGFALWHDSRGHKYLNVFKSLSLFSESLMYQRLLVSYIIAIKTSS